MKRKELEDLGLNKEQVDAVIKMNGADIENAKSVSAAEISNLQTENEGLTSQVKERDKQLETLKKSAGDNEDLQKQIEQLQSDNATAKANHESEMNQLKVQFAVEKALTGAKAKNNTAVKALLKDLDKAELGEDGTIKGLAEQIEALQKSDAYLFDTTTTKKTQVKGAKPGESGNEEGDHGVDTSKMTYSEMMTYLAENPDAKI